MAVLSQIFVRDLCGRSQCLQIDVSNLTGLFLKGRIYEKTLIPPSVQRLVTGIQEITDDYVLNPDDFGLFPSINLLLRLRGGKGGFGSLLRTSKAGQKKTNNFDACRDMSGRRLRHVNAERKMEEWEAEAENRKLEKVAEEFLKKQMMKEKKRPGNAQAENYLEKYREESSKSIDEVRAAVKESIGNVSAKGKGKVVEEEAQPSKRAKIWVQEDENEDSDDTDDDERSVILDNRNSDQSESFEQDGRGILRSVSVAPRLGRDGADGSTSSQTNDTSAYDSQKNVAGGISVQNIAIGNSSIAFIDSIARKSMVAASSKQGVGILKTLEEKSSMPASSPCSISHGNVELECAAVWKMDNEEDVGGGRPSSSGDGVLNFDEFQTSKDMERLKLELQGRGLKCGGTLVQRAERLFLLKTRSVDMIPKKHIAKTK